MITASRFNTSAIGLAIVSLSLALPSIAVAQEAAENPCELPRVDGSEPVDEQEPLGERLERCGGILEPPPVGDQEILGPAPDPAPGTTPVIPPGEVPIQ